MKNRFDILMELANDPRIHVDMENGVILVPQDFIEDVLKHADEIKPIMDWLDKKQRGEL